MHSRPCDIYTRLPAGLCKASKRFRFDYLVCVYPEGHAGCHGFVDPWTVVRSCEKDREESEQGLLSEAYYPLTRVQPQECLPFWRWVWDCWLWLHNNLPPFFWTGWLLLEVGRFWCRLVARLENDLNHPQWKEWPGSPGTRWGPLCHWVCDLADWLTGGRCHD